MHHLNKQTVAYVTGLIGSELEDAMNRISATIAKDEMNRILNETSSSELHGFYASVAIETGHEDGSLADRAARFAAGAHARVGQRRKYTGEPYIVHPKEVAALVATVSEDQEMIAAAWLHDTVEDTDVELEDIFREFGAGVAELVSDLTDVSRKEDGNRKVRKEIDRLHTARASKRAKTIKLADLISNTRSIVARDENFARVYLAEKKRLLEVLKEGSAVLYGNAIALYEESIQRLRLE